MEKYGIMCLLSRGGRVRPLANAERLEVKKLSFLSGVQDELPVKKGIDNAF